MIAQWILPILLVQSAVLGLNLWHWKRRNPRRQKGETSTLPVLSVLIPIRNERDKISALVDALREQTYDKVQIILCDDSSDDGTREWLQHNLPEYHESLLLSWFPAPEKPADWVGKNWACFHLGQKAQGDWLVFMDADIQLRKDSLETLAQYLASLSGKREPVYLVTAIPTLLAPSLLIGLLKNMLPFSIFTLLPLPLAEAHPHPAFAFANGQLIAFPKAFYTRTNPHQRVRHAILEDVQLARVVKSEDGQVRVIDGRSLLQVSMYNSLQEAVDGFSKNAVAICGAVWSAMLVAVMIALVYLLPLAEGIVSNFSTWHAIAGILSITLFSLSGWMAGLPAWYGLLYPVSVLIGEWTLWRSMAWYSRGTVKWKGRIYQVS